MTTDELAALNEKLKAIAKTGTANEKAMATALLHLGTWMNSIVRDLKA